MKAKSVAKDFPVVCGARHPAGMALRDRRSRLPQPHYRRADGGCTGQAVIASQ